MSDTLQTLGERAIVQAILPRFASSSGDDCASLGFERGFVVVTTDPVPVPAAKFFGGDPDLYWLGWLLVTINASDIAAAGATPVAFLAALEAPPSMERTEFERLLEGIRDACSLYELRYVGGNLKESERVHGVGVAVGAVSDGVPLTRTGARAGNLVYSVGAGGRFWRDVLHLKKSEFRGSKDSSPVFRPVAQVKAMAKARPYITAAIDNSDGLLPTLSQLAQASDVSIALDIELLTVEGIGADVDPARLWMGWGDWNVIVTVNADRETDFVESVNRQGSAATRIGIVRSETGVTLVRSGFELPAPRLESERFATDSWFSTGPDEYLRRLLAVELP